MGRLHGLDNDPEVMRWINGGLSVSLEDFESELFPVYFERDDGMYGFWIVESEHGFTPGPGKVRVQTDSPVSPGRYAIRYQHAVWGSLGW
jgi:hypothetical protein